MIKYILIINFYLALKGPLKEAHPFHLLEVGQYGEFEFIDFKDGKHAALQKHPDLLLSTVSLNTSLLKLYTHDMLLRFSYYIPSVTYVTFQLPYHIQEPFDAKAELEKQYMNTKKDFAMLEERVDRSARVWEPEIELFDLFHLDISKPFKSIELTLDYVTGEPSGVQEVIYGVNVM